MASVNLVIIMGNLGKDPELRQTTGGNSVCHFSVATNETWISNGHKQSHVEWHDVNVWGKMAENCKKFLVKGSCVHITGRINTRSWKNEGGVTISRKEIVARDVRFVDKKSINTDQSEPNQQESIPEDGVPEDMQ